MLWFESSIPPIGVECVHVEVWKSPAGSAVESEFAVENRPNTREVKLMAILCQTAIPGGTGRDQVGDWGVLRGLTGEEHPWEIRIGRKSDKRSRKD